MAVRLSALRAGRTFTPRKIPGTHFCYRLSRPQGHSAAGRTRSLEKSSGLIGIWTRDLPACSIAPQPNYATACPHEVLSVFYLLFSHKKKLPMTIRNDVLALCKLKLSVLGWIHRVSVGKDGRCMYAAILLYLLVILPRLGEIHWLSRTKRSELSVVIPRIALGHDSW
jgi:hypothetical protein